MRSATQSVSTLTAGLPDSLAVILAVIAGWAGAMALAAFCHHFGLVSHSLPRGYSAPPVGYPYSQYLSSCVKRQGWGEVKTGGMLDSTAPSGR
jgi:hypothetical protein